jgi:Flp pilus assembly protein TadD
VRQKNLPDAIVSLKRAMDLAPKEARYGYVYAVALDSAGRKRGADRRRCGFETEPW